MRRDRLVELLAGRWRTLPVLIALVAIWVFFSSQSDVFLSSHNLSNLSLQIVVTGVIALALVLVLLVGEIDLSVVYLSVVCAAIAATLSEYVRLPLALALAGGVGVGAIWGLGQGFVTTYFRVPSFIVTLGASLILTAALLEVLPADGQILLARNPIASIANAFLPSWLSYVGLAATLVIVGLLKLHTYQHRRRQGLAPTLAGSVVAPVAMVGIAGAALVVVFDGYRGVPVAVTVLLILLGVFAYVTTQTRFGTYLYAIGGNPEAARRAGIPVMQVKIIVFMLAGALTAIGGTIAASRVLTVSSQVLDPALLLEAIAAAVIGGASLFGGRGSVWAALTGALVIGSITNGLLLLDVSTPTRLMVQGAILLLAVIADAAISRAASVPSVPEPTT